MKIVLIFWFHDSGSGSVPKITYGDDTIRRIQVTEESGNAASYAFPMELD
jgi:hypothetical protein